MRDPYEIVLPSQAKSRLHQQSLPWYRRDSTSLACSSCYISHQHMQLYGSSTVHHVLHPVTGILLTQRAWLGTRRSTQDTFHPELPIRVDGTSITHCTPLPFRPEQVEESCHTLRTDVQQPIVFLAPLFPFLPFSGGIVLLASRGFLLLRLSRCWFQRRLRDWNLGITTCAF